MDLIPDSSFFICFFEDIKDFVNPEDLINFFSIINSNFDIQVTPIVRSEITKKHQYHIYDVFAPEFIYVNFDQSTVEDLTLLEILKPLVGKGEFEVIALAKYYQQEEANDFIFVLDDDEARSKIKLFLNELEPHLKGTVGLIKFGCINLGIFNCNDSINILRCIENSNFRISSMLINSITNEVRDHCSGD